MAFQVLMGTPEGKRPEDDYVWRRRHENAARQDPKEVFKTVEVSVDDGPPDAKGKRVQTPIKLRYALDSQYVFAVYSENQGFHARGEDEWMSAATKAIEKFAAIHGHQVKFGPRSEDGIRFNVMAELDRPVEQSEGAKAQLAAHAEARKAAMERQEMLRKLGMV